MFEALSDKAFRAGTIATLICSEERTLLEIEADFAYKL